MLNEKNNVLKLVFGMLLIFTKSLYSQPDNQKQTQILIDNYHFYQSYKPRPLGDEWESAFFKFYNIFEGKDTIGNPLAKLDSLVKLYFNNDSIWCTVFYVRKDKKNYYFNKKSIYSENIKVITKNMVYIKVAFWELVWNRFIMEDIDINYKYPKDYKAALELWKEIFPHMFRCNVNGAMKICYDVDYNKIIKQNPKLHLCKKDEYLKRAKQGYLKIKIPKS